MESCRWADDKKGKSCRTAIFLAVGRALSRHVTNMHSASARPGWPDGYDYGCDKIKRHAGCWSVPCRQGTYSRPLVHALLEAIQEPDKPIGKKRIKFGKLDCLFNKRERNTGTLLGA